MLFPILQAIWQQFGPQATQFINSPAFSELLKNMGRVSPQLYVQCGRVVSQGVAQWYQSLSAQEKQRFHNVLIWLTKDLAGDIAAAATGLPIGALVDFGVDKLQPDDEPSNPESVTALSILQRYLNQS